MYVFHLAAITPRPPGHDVYRGFVIVAPNDATARALAAEVAEKYDGGNYWTSPACVWTRVLGPYRCKKVRTPFVVLADSRSH